MSTDASPTSLDPILGGAGTDHVSLYPLYDRLVNVGEDLTPEPGLAESWEFVDDSTLVFTLRADLKFQDGTPLDAEAVKFNIDRARELPTSTVKAELGTIKDVEATSDTEVTITLTQMDASLIGVFADRAGMMVSPTAVEESGDSFEVNPVGAGPFSFVSYASGDELVLTKNEHYWQPDMPYLDDLTMKYIPNGQTADNALLDQQIDMSIVVGAQSIDSLKAQQGIVVGVDTSSAQEACYFNVTKPPMDSKAARQAIAYAIDRDALTEALLFGHGGEPADQILPKAHWAYQKDLPEEYKYAHDPKKAAELWTEAGADGETITIIGYNSPGQSRKLEIIQSQLEEAGIDAQIQMMDVGAANEAFFTNHETALYCSGWSGRPDPSAEYTSLLSPEGFSAPKGWVGEGDNAGADLKELVDAGKLVTDQDERVKANRPLVELTRDEMLYLPLLHTPRIVAFQDYVEGYQPTLLGKPNVSFLWVTKN
ncbi:ABC transporter substrate-binding protein [Cumulibacter soli]|uniref:ABC transporter substrate-binding protein n=1 Tax=Cumulibacter soli TaxID=2546344 RepID=UPI0014193A65|nr:ABC transporter substrate-binding protein [Cumulibacter soli]